MRIFLPEGDCAFAIESPFRKTQFMSRINGDKARNDRQRKHREKMRVKTRELREHLAGAGSAAKPAAASVPKTAAK